MINHDKISTFLSVLNLFYHTKSLEPSHTLLLILRSARGNSNSHWQSNIANGGGVTRLRKRVLGGI